MKALVSAFFVVSSLAAAARADQFVSGQSADAVIGQSTFTDTTFGVSTTKFKSPQGMSVDPTTGKLFLVDSGNFRILRYASVAAALGGQGAEAVFGQPDFSSNTANQGLSVGPKGLGLVFQIQVDHIGRLWVCDTSNHRVICFLNASSRSNNPDADLVFGQPNFVFSSSGLSQSGMNTPCGVAVGSDDTLWVADTYNHRILRFANVSSKSSGANADGILGQALFTTNFFGPTTNNLREPFGLAADSAGRLWVADSMNHRVLRYDNAASLADADGAPASGVLGQPDFGSSLTVVSATGMNSPFGLLPFADGTLWVTDFGNRRVLGFRNAAAKGNGTAADFVIGQPDFITNGTVVTASRLSAPAFFVEAPGGSFLVSEPANHRVLRFSPVKSPVLTIATRSATVETPTARVRGRASGQVTKITYRVGKRGRFRKAAGTNTWNFTARLQKGANLITVIAEGPGGTSPNRKITLTRK